MKKTSVTNHIKDQRDELRKEYHFDYRKAKPNRFVEKHEQPRVVVVLDPDIAEVFETPDSVNEVLRALIKTMPRLRRTVTKSGRPRTSV